MAPKLSLVQSTFVYAGFHHAACHVICSNKLFFIYLNLPILILSCSFHLIMTLQLAPIMILQNKRNGRLLVISLFVARTL